jgi:hypothetical protein
MRYSKQDLPKIVVLAVVLIGLVVYIGISYSSLSEKYRKQEAAHAAWHEQQHATATGPATPPGASNPGAPIMSPMVAALITPVSPPDRDPFLPVIAPPNVFAPQPKTHKPGQPRTPDPLSLPPLAGSGPGQLTFSKDSNALALTGIIVGPPSLAVIRRGQDHFIVAQGGELPGKVRVQAITRNSITLKDGKREYVLRLGQ